MNRYILIIAIWLFSSCRVEEIAPLAEAPKNVTGSWKVIKATRNGTDITTAFDFTQFRLKFDSTDNYILINKLPFLVNKNGKYKLDDPAYPFKLTMTPDGGSAVSTSFNYPTIAGIRQLSLTFIPGCELNSYIYTLEREN
ncbi:DUF5004 domain-containing protein [Chitinophaga oryziterrae]|uniref:DUF5004 domain-containing protein n=1 Tax=Chitinophaga oryziterrae TaxID=1031224 RepID=A0A6N8JF10_9BACT|nr:DUF5004 domain-containing protein [Chitinophaga oryziterrae]MVT42908.1 DUF5004 domain-containing protein [Chitinophaga oryziterrae]